MSFALAFASLVVLLLVAILALGAVIGLTIEIMRGFAALGRSLRQRRAEPARVQAVRTVRVVEPARPHRGLVVSAVPALS